MCSWNIFLVGEGVCFLEVFFVFCGWNKKSVSFIPGIVNQQGFDHQLTIRQYFRTVFEVGCLWQAYGSIVPGMLKTYINDDCGL